MLRPLLCCFVALAVLLSACSIDDPDSALGSFDSDDMAEPFGADDERDELDTFDAEEPDAGAQDSTDADPDDQSLPANSDDSATPGGYDPTLTSTDPCLDNESDPTPGIEYTVAHHVVGGVLGATCFGSEDDTLLRAWKILGEITPPGQLRDLAIFSGFQAARGSNDGTLAFVAPIDDDGTQFQMAVNLPASNDDWDEAALTMAHEFSHVFTAVPTELDRYASPDDCATYDNLEGCYTDDSIMAGWYQRFWPEFNYDPSGGQEADEVDGERRCEQSPAFFGAYSASNPEEDFAESFSAYVMRVEAATAEQQDKLDWIDQYEGLREFRDRATAAGYGPFPNNFGVCGLN